MYSVNNMQKEIRAAAKRLGLTFKQDGHAYFNSVSRPMYSLFKRGTAEKVYGIVTVEYAYNDLCSGYIHSWNGQNLNNTANNCSE